ncbi:MAG TPA: class I SAM-dependent methyltransferase [Stellaceae bacterium]|jgi:SAM-dependent methyltransferase|nr:class I SAM-dependent methyltransferase [Stellaceae bacterium]
MTEPTANTAMQRYWNEVAGPRWVGRAGIQEARNLEVADILQRAAAPRQGERVLDIGCGTGATTIPFAAAVAPEGTVTGVDIAEPMLAQCRQNIAKAGAGNIDLLLADAQTHAFAAGAYDLLISRFGVMFFADPVAAFTNLFKGLKKGGRLCMAVWSTLDDNVHWKIPFEIAVKHLGPPDPSPPNTPGPMAFRDPDHFGDILAKSGFGEIRIDKRRFHIAGQNAEAEAEHSSGAGPAWRLMEEKHASDAQRQAIVAETAAAFAPYRTADGMRLPGNILLARATRAAQAT